MARLAMFLVATAIFAAAPNAWPDDATPSSSDAKIDAIVSNVIDTVARTYGPAASFCSANHEPSARSAEDSLQAFLSAVSTGTRAAFDEIARTEPDFSASPPPTKPDTLDAMVDQQADAIMKRVQADPAAGCQRFFALVEASADAALIKASALQGYRDHLARSSDPALGTPEPAGGR